MTWGPTQEIGIRVHRRQFLVGPEAVKVYDDWYTRRLGPSVWLSYCPSLPMGFAQDRDGVLWCLAGLAVQGQADCGAPLEEIADVSTSAVPEVSYNWAGRWALMNPRRLYLDATGVLGCYYGEHDGKHWTSSSPALISNQLYGQSPPPPLCPQPAYRKGIDWTPPPLTRTPGVMRIIPSQSLGLDDGKAAYRPLIPRIKLPVDAHDVVGQVQQRLLTTVRNLASLNQPIWLGLTAGRDSRAVLALCKTTGLPIKAFTRNTLRMSVADHVLPPKLAAKCGVPHQWAFSKPNDPERRAIAEQHSAGEVAYGNMLPFLNGSRDELDGVMIGGHGFELFSTPVLQELPGNMGDDIDSAARTILYDNYDDPDQKPHHTAAMAAWLRWIREHPEDQLDWQARYAMEQENGGWLAHKELVYDLDRVTRFPLLNCALNYAQLLAIPPKQRMDDQIHTRLIQAAAPELLGLPFNPPDTHFGAVGLIRAKSFRLPVYLYGAFCKRLYKFKKDKLNDRAYKAESKRTADASDSARK